MATRKQIQANRRNARKSKGSKTREGKFRSSLNALRHGAYAQNYVIKSEDEQVFRNFATDFLDHIQPTSPAELELLDQMLLAAWRRRRLTAIINQRIDQAIDQVCAAEQKLAAEIPCLTVRAFEMLETEKPNFAHQERLELRFASTFQRALSRLESSRKFQEAQKTKAEKGRNDPNFNLTPLTRAA